MDWTETSATSNPWQLRSILRSCRAARISYPLVVDVECITLGNTDTSKVQQCERWARRPFRVVPSFAPRLSCDWSCLSNCLLSTDGSTCYFLCTFNPLVSSSFLRSTRFRQQEWRYTILPRKPHPQLDFFGQKALGTTRGARWQCSLHTPPPFNTQNTVAGNNTTESHLVRLSSRGGGNIRHPPVSST